MEIKQLKLKNGKNHDYFVRSVCNILSKLGFPNCSFEEIEKMCIENSYYLYFHNGKTKRWHLGIWAVGNWDIEEEIDGKAIKCGYGIETYKPLTISVFLIHDWTYDKFRPSRSDWEAVINYGEEYDETIAELKNYLKNPIQSYYSLVDEDSYNFQHRFSNKYMAYIRGWYRNCLKKAITKKYNHWCGYLLSEILMLMAFFDKRIYHSEYKYKKSEWNAEYEIAIVFEYGITEWDDWKRWNDYNRIYRKFQKWSGYNIEVDFTYLDEEGKMPKNIWRGVYWEEEPEK